MFSVQQKRDIADKIQAILRETNHPELPTGEIQFRIQIQGRAPWSWADILNNGAVPNPEVNPWNEKQYGMDDYNHKFGKPPFNQQHNKIENKP